MKIFEITKLYFDSYSRKDINFFYYILDNKVSLVDWAISLSGKDAVLKNIKETFQNFQNISVNVRNIEINGNISVTNFEINLDKEKLNVIDKITFTENNQIIFIEAFKI